MARLARFTFVVADPTTGLPVSGASVEVRSQGATVNGDHTGAVTSFTVNNPGAVVATNTVVIDATSTPTRAVASITATNVTVAAAGFEDIDDDQRISIALPLPTLYNDASGDESKTNPLTTDANGLAECWIVGSNFDVLVSKSGVLTTTLYEDVATVGGEEAQSNVHNSGSIPAWVLDSLRTLDDGQPLLSLRNAGTNKHRFFADGSWRSVKGGTIDAGGLTISGGGITSTGASVLTGAVSGVTTLSASGDITTSGGDFDGRRLTMGSGTNLVTGDFTLTGWGSGASISVNGNSKDTVGGFTITSGTSVSANPTVKLTFKDGAWDTNPKCFINPGFRADGSGAWLSPVTLTSTAITWEADATPADSTAFKYIYFCISGD
jgi:hypothetical protein